MPVVGSVCGIVCILGMYGRVFIIEAVLWLCDHTGDGAEHDDGGATEDRWPEGLHVFTRY